MTSARKLLAVAVGAAIGSSAWGQAPPPGTYQFISGPGVGTPPFTVSGFSTSLGGSVSSAHLPFCSGLHVHGTFNGFADPMSGGCGHGIIQLLVPPPPVSGGSSLVNPSGSFPGGMPTNVAGQLALTTPRVGVQQGLPLAAAGDAFMLAIAGFAVQSGATDEDSTAAWSAITRLSFRGQQSLSEQIAGAATEITLSTEVRTAGSPLPKEVVKTTLTNPAQSVLTSPATLSILEEFAAYDDQTADGYRRDAEITKRQSGEWRKLADDARDNATRNRDRADQARKEGREADARNWEEEAKRDDAEAQRRDGEAGRLDGWSEEMRDREQAARDQAQARRDAAEAAREAARQAERDRAERVRQQAEEKARLQREAREKRLAEERAEREARIRELEDRVRAREAEAARQRAAQERAHRQWLAEQEAQRNARARGSSSDADLAAAAARRKKKQEEEEKTWADYVIEFIYGSEGEMAKEKGQDLLKDAAKDWAGERTGISGKIDDLGVGPSLGKLAEGVETVNKVKKIGDALNEQMDKLPDRQRRIEAKMEALEARQASSGRDLRSGSLSWRESLDTVVPIIKASQ
jgi:hypothetical protein